MARSEARVSPPRHSSFASLPLARREQLRAEQFARQGGVCALCDRPPSKPWALTVDHCHSGGQLRGLLCASCNGAMSAIDRGDEWLQRAIAYRDSGGVWGDD